MEIKPIGPEHAAEVAAIERAMHDPRLVQGERRLRAFLQRAVDSGKSSCFGLFRNGEMGGYLMCGDLMPSQFPQLKGDRAIYIYDISVLPKFRRLTFRLLTTWWDCTREYFPDSAVEMHIIEEGKQLWLSHANTLSKKGMEFQLCEYLHREYKGQRRYRMRFNQIADYKHRSFDLEAHSRTLPVIETAGDLELRVLHDDKVWPYYAEQLQSLYDDSVNKTPAMDYWFQRSCWLHQGYGHQLQYLLLYRGDELKAAVPLYVHQSKNLLRQSQQSVRQVVPGFGPAILGALDGPMQSLLDKHLPATPAPCDDSPEEPFQNKVENIETECFEAGAALDNALIDLELLHCTHSNDAPQLTAMHNFMQHASFDAEYLHNFSAELLVLRVHKQAIAAAYILNNDKQAWIAVSGRNIGNGYGNSQRLAAKFAVDHMGNKPCTFITRQ